MKTDDILQRNYDLETGAIEKSLITSLIQQVEGMKKYDNGVGSFTTDLAIPDDWVGYNKACDDFIKLLQSQTKKGEAHAR